MMRLRNTDRPCSDSAEKRVFFETSDENFYFRYFEIKLTAVAIIDNICLLLHPKLSNSKKNFLILIMFYLVFFTNFIEHLQDISVFRYDAVILRLPFYAVTDDRQVIICYYRRIVKALPLRCFDKSSDFVFECLCIHTVVILNCLISLQLQYVHLVLSVGVIISCCHQCQHLMLSSHAVILYRFIVSPSRILQ
jgi:hypothetical protein